MSIILYPTANGASNPKSQPCISALTSITHDWVQLLETGQEVGVIFFDHAKAFDRVPRGPLLSKLTADPHIIIWLHNYLGGRKQTVIINGTNSDHSHVISGVPSRIDTGPPIVPYLYR